MLHAHRESLAAQAAGWRRLVTPTLLIALLFYVVGIFTPYARMDSLGVATIDQVSFFQATLEAFIDGMALMASVSLAWMIFIGWQLCTLLALWRCRPAGALRGDWRFRLLRLFWLVVINVGVFALAMQSASLFRLSPEPRSLYLAVTLALSSVAAYGVVRSAQLREAIVRPV